MSEFPTLCHCGLTNSTERFTPWQIILTTLTTLYAVRNMDKILGLEAPEPLARLVCIFGLFYASSAAHLFHPSS